MAKIGMKAAHLRKINKVLDGEVPGHEVLVYGSWAQGKAGAYSYLDLALVADKPLGAERMEKLAATFLRAGLPFKVESVDWAATGSAFRREIKRTAVQFKPAAKRAAGKK
jgi:predicted nucleotidyltransferase